MGKLLKIGELARAAGCTVKAVRFYEAEGLLPKPARSPSGYRLYTEQSVKLLQFIGRAKLIGLPLAKIGELMVHLGEAEWCPTVRPHLEQLVRAQLVETNAKLAQLALLKEEMEGLLTKMRRAHQILPAELCVCTGSKEPVANQSSVSRPIKRHGARHRSPCPPSGANQRPLPASIPSSRSQR